MGTLGGYYLNAHRTQFDGSVFERENCSPAAAANGADACTSGVISRRPSQVRALLNRWEETDPNTPGWSIPDIDRAMGRLGIPYENHTGRGWTGVLRDLAAGLYLTLQGDSDQFSNATCSGAFNGGHCIGIHPATRLYNGLRQHWINDGICTKGRWEYDYVIRRYGAKISAGMRYGAFASPVHKTTATPASGKFECQIHDRTNLYNLPNGRLLGTVTSATYTCTRTYINGSWWYQIPRTSPSANRGRWFKGNSDHMKVTKV